MSLSRTKLFALFAVLFLAACFSLLRGTRSQEASVKLPFAFAQPAPPKVSAFSLVGALSGLRAIAADWIYVEMLQYYASEANRLDGRFGKIGPMVGEMIWLDPTFHFGIQYGSAIVGWNLDRPAEATALLNRAILLDPGYSRYQLYLAALSYRGDAEGTQSIPLLERLVRQPDRSEILVRILGNLYIKHAMWDKARAYRTSVQQTTDQPLSRVQAEKALKIIAQSRRLVKGSDVQR